MKKGAVKNKAIPKMAVNFKILRKQIFQLDFYTLSKIVSGATASPGMNSLVKIATYLTPAGEKLVK